MDVVILTSLLHGSACASIDVIVSSFYYFVDLFTTPESLPFYRQIESTIENAYDEIDWMSGSVRVSAVKIRVYYIRGRKGRGFVGDNRVKPMVFLGKS